MKAGFGKWKEVMAMGEMDRLTLWYGNAQAEGLLIDWTTGKVRPRDA